MVAFSGGTDSALLAKVAQDTLGRAQVLCATAISPSLAATEADDCRALALEWDLRWVGVPTDEMQDPTYVANGADRCARCKTALMSALGPLALAESARVVLGVNVSDLGDHRPGQAAAAAGATFPLVRAGFTKDDIRHWSKELGLRTWDKPAAACLASRLPYGTPVTLGRLEAVDAAEAALRALGFGQLRVRHHGTAARLEFEPDELPGGAGPPPRGGGRGAVGRVSLRRIGPGRLPLGQHESDAGRRVPADEGRQGGTEERT